MCKILMTGSQWSGSSEYTSEVFNSTVVVVVEAANKILTGLNHRQRKYHADPRRHIKFWHLLAFLDSRTTGR